MSKYEALARAYFATWCSHSSTAVGACFAADGTLRDWDVSAEGREAVVKANQGIFDAVPNIKVEILNIFCDDAKATAACEIIVHVHDDANTTLKARGVVRASPQHANSTIRPLPRANCRAGRCWT